jgi:hypothetical protein
MVRCPFHVDRRSCREILPIFARQVHGGNVVVVVVVDVNLDVNVNLDGTPVYFL